MRFQRAPLGVVQRSWLCQNRRRHAQHPRVKEQSGHYGPDRIAPEISVVPHQPGQHSSHGQAVAGDELGWLSGGNIEETEGVGLLGLGEKLLRQVDKGLDVDRFLRVQRSEKASQDFQLGSLTAAPPQHGRNAGNALRHDLQDCLQALAEGQLSAGSVWKSLKHPQRCIRHRRGLVVALGQWIVVALRAPHSALPARRLELVRERAQLAEQFPTLLQDPARTRS